MSRRAACDPNASTSWLRAVNDGYVCSQSTESSQAMIDTSPGTARPNSCASANASLTSVICRVASADPK